MVLINKPSGQIDTCKLSKSQFREDLKVANFESFFTDTCAAVSQRLENEEESVQFVELLQSQLLQRLLKSAAASRGGKLNIEFLAKFVFAMVDHLAATEDGRDSDQYELAEALKVILDPASAPSKVKDAHTLFTGADHWLPKAFALDNGKKVLRAATDHAENRTEADAVLVKLDLADVGLRTHLEDVETGKPPGSAFGSASLS